MTQSEKLVAYANSQIGTAEDPLGSNKQKYGALIDSTDWYLYKKGDETWRHKVNGYDWCTQFVDASFITTFGIDAARKMLYRPVYNNMGAVVKYAFNYFKNAGQGFTKEEYTPKPGDVIYFQNSKGLSHTGIVTAVDDKTVTTVEGNSGKNCWYVAKHNYKLTNAKIYGYGHPNYTVDPEPEKKELDGYTVGKKYCVSCNALNVRTAATKDSGIVTTINHGAEVECLALTHDDNGNTWMRISNGWICCIESGKVYVVPAGWGEKDGKWYYYKSGDMIKSEWVKWHGNWYYLGADGAMLTGWQEIDGKKYYLYPDGHMAKGEWIDGLWLDNDGSQTYPYKGEWKSDKKGKWFEDEKGWYPKAEVQRIDGKDYDFDAKGYLIGG